MSAQNYEPINANYPAAVGGSYTVRAGESLQSIAQSLWGDAQMYALAQAGQAVNTAKTANDTLSWSDQAASWYANLGNQTAAGTAAFTFSGTQATLNAGVSAAALGAATGKFSWRQVAASTLATGISRYGDSLIPDWSQGDASARHGLAWANSLVSGWAANAVVFDSTKKANNSAVLGNLFASTVGNALGESIVAEMRSSSEPTLAQRQGSTQKALDNLARLADEYGGIQNVPANLPEVQEALRLGKGNGATIEQLVRDRTTAARIGSSVRLEQPQGDVVAPATSESGEPVQQVVITGDASGPRAARLAATAGGVVAGMFQSIGDGVIGLASLVKDGLAVQQYMLLGGDTDLNRSLPGYAARRQGFETFGAIAEGVKLVASDPVKFFGDAAGRTFDGIQTALNTAQDRHELSDWFFYGAQVGHATMDIAGLVGGVAALPRLATGAAGLAVNGLRATAQWLAPKAGAMVEGYMARTGGILYAAPSEGLAGGSAGSARLEYLGGDTGQVLAYWPCRGRTHAQ